LIIQLDNESRLIAGLKATDRAQLTSLLRKWPTSLESAAANGPHLRVNLGNSTREFGNYFKYVEAALA
jgi:hypothetical protein